MEKNRYIMERISNIFNYLEEKQRFLTPYQFNFVKSLKRYFISGKRLTIRQIEWLEDIMKYMNVPASAF